MVELYTDSCIEKYFGIDPNIPMNPFIVYEGITEIDRDHSNEEDTDIDFGIIEDR